MSNEPSLRALTPAVVFVKLRKVIDAKISRSEILKRINLPGESCIDELAAILDNREKFYEKVEDINQVIKRRRAEVNNAKIMDELKVVNHMQPITCSPTVSIDWHFLPKHLIPSMMCLGTYLAGKRKDWQGLARRMQHGARKMKQIETFIALLRDTVGTCGNLRVLDLCGGRGDLALMLAYMNPNWSVCVFDRNKLGLLQAEYRARCLGLANFSTQEVDLFNLELNEDDHWDVVIGLHACGSLSDVILSKFSKRCKNLFVATCCFGKMKNPHKFSKYADSDIGGMNTESSRLAKLVINSERCLSYPTSKLLEIEESSFSSKNQIIYMQNSSS